MGVVETYTRNHEANPIAARRLHDEHLPIEVKKHIKAQVARLRHYI
jgi:hypothetical protein